MNPLRTLVALFALLLACAGMPALAQDYPPVPKGPVYDGADMLSDATEAALDAKLRAYTAQTGRAIVVATVPTIGDQTIDQYGFGLFNAWGIGGKERDMGLLLVIARQERKMRIEVGYGLHPWFGGIMAGRVINDVITPRFKAGDFDTGVTEGVDAILAHLAKSPQDAKAIEEAAAAAARQNRGSEGGIPVGAIIWIAFIVFFFVLPALGRGSRRSYRGSGIGDAVGNIVLWEAGKAIARGLSDNDHGDWGGGGGFGDGGFGGGGGFGGFGGGSSGGGGASGGW